MAAPQPKKQRRRIVPILIASPSQEREAELPVTDALEEAPLPAADQRQQSEWAREHLGLDRKVFVDLSALQNRELDWKQLCKERGVQKLGRKAAPEENGTGADPLLSRAQGRTNRQEDAWTRMLSKLEATYCVGGLSEDEDEEAQGDEEGSDSGGSDDEEEEEGGGGKGASDGGGGGEAKDGKEGGAKKKGPKNDYDYHDTFIDDEEFIELVQHDKRKPKHTGFVISKGEIERTEEMLPGFEDLEKELKRGGGGGGGKRKADAAAGDDGGSGAPAKDGTAGAAAGGEKKKKRKQQEAGDGGEGGTQGEEGKPPVKKKKKVVAEAVGGPAGAVPAPGAAAAAKPLSISERARMAGQLAAAGGLPLTAGADAARAGSPTPSASQPSAPPSAKKRGPYELPAEVAAAIAAVRSVAEQQPVPAPAPAAGEGGEDGKPKARRQLPKPIREALLRFSPVYLDQTEKFGQPAANRIMDELLPFLEPFAARHSLNNVLRNANKEKKAKEAGPGMTAEQLKALINAKVKPLPVTSDDDFEAPPAPRSTASPPTQPGGAAQAPAGAAPGPAATNKYLKHIDRGVQQQVYQHLRRHLGDESVHSAKAKVHLQEVYNWFPANSIDPAGVTALYNREKSRAKKAAERAAAAAATAAPAPTAAAALAAPAPAPTAASAAPAPQPGPLAGLPAAALVALPPGALAMGLAMIQQQQRQVQQAAQQAAQQPAQPLLAGPGGLSHAQLYAALAVASAEKKLGPSPQRPAQQEAAPATAPAADAGRSLAAAANGATLHPVQAGHAVAAAAAQEAEEALAYASQAAMSPQQPHQGAAQLAPRQSDTLSAVQAQAQPQQVQAQQQQQQPSQAVAQVVAKPESEYLQHIIQAGMQFGCDPQQLQAVLAGVANNRSQYAGFFPKVLVLAGPGGITVADAARRVVDNGWADWDPTKLKSATNIFSKLTHESWVSYVGSSKYALTCMPGIAVAERPKRAPPKKSGQAAPGGGASRAASVVPGESDGRDEEQATADAAQA